VFDDGILGTEPPDDAGSATFGRYCYQARVAFRYALACAAGHSVEAIVPEHLEDLAVHFSGGEWHLLQIKTRDLGYGPWRLSDVLGEDGAFRSLARTYRSLPMNSMGVLFFASLEGAIAHGDDLGRFVGSSCSDPRIVERIQSRLDLTAEEAEGFVPRLRVQPESPQSAIDAMNIRRLGACMQNGRHGDIEAAYRDALTLIQMGMEATLLGPDWALEVTEPADEQTRIRVLSKLIDRGRLSTLAGHLTAHPAPLLTRLLVADRWPATQLEEKLLAGGALTEVISNALQMRAMADHWAAEKQAAALWPDDDVTTDLDLRLRFLATAAVARHSAEASPANGAWADVHDRLTTEPVNHDPRQVFAQDPVLLMGRVCSLSDQCAFEWRGTRA
jgi:hypothetical protein